MPVEPLLLPREAGELALQPLRPRQHGVYRLEHVGGGRRGVHGRLCRLLQGALDEGAIVLDCVVRGAEVLSQQFKGESQEWLVLPKCQKVSMVRRRVGGNGGAMLGQAWNSWLFRLLGARDFDATH